METRSMVPAMVRMVLVERMVRGRDPTTLARMLALAGAGSLLPAGCGTSQSSAPDAGGATNPADASRLQACTVAPPVPTDWRLSAAGTSFQDGLGRVVFL